MDTHEACPEYPQPHHDAAPASLVGPRNPAPPPAPLWLRIAAPAFVALATAVVFVPVLLAGFVHWDDYALVMSETRYRSLGGGRLSWMFTTSFAGHWQPLTWLSFWLDYRLAGTNVFGFHLTNFVLHALNAVLFYGVSLRILHVAFHPPQARYRAADVFAAGVAALLFSVHPLRVESVAWIAERRDVLSGAFFLLAVLSWLRYVDAVVGRKVAGLGRTPTTFRADVQPELLGLRPQACARWYLTTLVCFALSLSAKASGMMLPLVFLLLDAWPFRRVQWSGEGRWRRWGVLLVEKVPFLAVSTAVGWRAVVAQYEGGALYDLSQHGVWDRLAQAVHGLVFYPVKTALPIGLGPLYEIPADDVLFGVGLHLGLALVLGGIMTALLLRQRLPAVAAALAAYALLITPVLGLFQSGPQFVADRYSYLSTLPLTVFAAGSLAKGMRTRAWQHSGTKRALAVLATVACLTTLGHLSFAQSSYWQDGLTLWTRGVKVAPKSAVAHTNLADAYARNGPEGYGLAVRHYRMALRLNPRSAIALDHLGRVLERVGRAEVAVSLYKQALSVDPRRREAALALGTILAQLGRGQEAVAVWKSGLAQFPGDLEFQDALADILATFPDVAVRDGAEAVTHAQAASAARGHRDPYALLRLATALGEAGRFGEAREAAARASAFSPADDEAFAQELGHRSALLNGDRKFVTPGS